MWWLLFSAFLLRLPLLHGSLWLDEAIEALALRGHYGSILGYALSDFQPPLYHFLLRVWTNFAGYSEIALRFPSLMAGIALVFLTVKLGAVLFSRRIGFIAGWLVATNPLLIYYSQEGRTYIITALFVTASLYYLLRLLKTSHPSPPALFIYYFLFTTLALWSSYLAWVVVLIQFLYLLARRRYRLAGFSLLAALTLLVWSPSLFRSLTLGLHDARAIPGWGKVVGGISPKALALTWLKTAIGRISFVNKYFYGGLACTLAFLHAFVLRRVRPAVSLPIITLVATIAFTALVSLKIPVYAYFRLLFLVPLYELLLASGLSRSSLTLTTAFLVLNLVFVGIFYLTPRFHHEDWRSLTKYLNTRSGKVILPSLKQDAPFVYYRLALPLSSLDTAELVTSPIYYVKYAEEVFDSAHLGTTKLVRAGYTLSAELSFTGIPLAVYEK